MDDKYKIVNSLLEKLVNEEIMTKSEFQWAIDNISERHEANICSEFQGVHSKIQALQSSLDKQLLKINTRYNWVIGVTIISLVGVIGILFRVISILY